jgi:hypothetical protein
MNCSPAGPAYGAITYNAANNHLLPTSTFTYDLAVNLTGDGTNTYHWDAESRMEVAYTLIRT